MIYMTFNQWADGNFLETGEPRKKAYSQAELDLVEMGWNYGYDAGVQWQKSQQALEQERALQALHDENERLGLYKDAYGKPEPECVIDKSAAIRIATSLGWTPKREWQGLTADEIVMIGVATGMEHIAIHMIENKLKEKNL
jgi:hypothetical protein